jgi:hypothetical protein
MKYAHKSLVLLLAWGFLAARSNFAQTSSEPPQAAQQSQEQLQQIVAPIALYPDALVAQILPAASYPEQIVEAAQWLGAHKGVQGDQLAREVDAQPWDESVKALTQFPAVLANMKQNLAWTSELGDAYVNQQPEVSQAIQTMRQRAKQAGNLKDNPQEKVKTKGNTIVIEPSAPDVVYVPEYDPWLAYGTPLAVFPEWYPYPGLFWDGPGIGFGAGFGVGLFAGYGWGWHHWDFDWHDHGRIEYDHHTYVSHSTTIVNRNHFSRGQSHSNHGEDSRNVFSGRQMARPNVSRAAPAIHSGAFGGFTHGGIARGNAFRGQSSFGGFHGGGFHGGGFHGVVGGHGGGGHR